MDTQTKNEKIDAAIKAHIAWFGRLRTAIETGKSDFDPKVVATDNQCEFGKWLYLGLVGICEKSQYERIKCLHAGFHKKASEILKQALDGKKEAAASQITSSSDLGKLSGELILLLRGMQVSTGV